MDDAPASNAAAATSADFARVRWFARTALVIGLIAFAVQLAEIPWRSALRGYDNTFNYFWLRSLAVDGDWDFANDIEEANTLAAESRGHARGLPPTALGRVPNKYGVGWALLSTPGYIVAELVVRTGRAIGLWSLAPDGFNPVYQVCLQSWHVFLALVALVLARRILATWLPEPWATAGIATVWLASPLLYYQTSNVGMTHNAAFFAVTIATYGLVRGVARPGARWPWLLAGAGFGLAAVTRYQTLVFGLIALWAWSERVRQHGWRGLGVIGWMFVGGVPFVALQAWAWHAVYGRWLVFSYGVEGEKFLWFDPRWTAVFSPWHGLYYWHPLLLVATIGVVWWALQRRGPALALAGSALATLYVNAAWWCWWFAGAFGSRAFDAGLLALMGGQAFLFARASRAGRRVLWIAAVLLAAWNVYVFVLYRSAAISRNAPVTWTEMLQAAPRLRGQLSFDE